MNLSNLTKKLSLIILSSILFLNSMAMPFAVAHAADEAPSTWYNQGFTDWYAKVYDDKISPSSEIFGERYTAAQVQWIIYSLVALPLQLDTDSKQVIACFVGTMSGNLDILTCSDALIERFNKFDEFFNSQKTGRLSNSKSAFASIFDYKNRSISGIGYLSNLSGRLHIVSNVNAQGFGYTALNPIQTYWSGFRNIAYALVVMVTIVFSFMIMFRIKLSPQLVISVQSALPKVFVALILATFSYAIAGFLIDLMYVIGGVLAALLVSAGFAGPNGSFGGVFGVYYDIFPSNETGLYFLTHMIVYDIFFAISFIVNMATSMFTLGGGVPRSIFAIVGLLLIVWIFILSIWYTLKTTWVLVKNLLSIYMSIIIGPVQIVLGAIAPNIGFGLWFRKLLTELLVFPVTGVFMFFAWRLMWSSYGFAFKSDNNLLSFVVGKIGGWLGYNPSLFDAIWVPEILGFGDSVSGFLVLLMSFGVLTFVPKVPDILKSLIMGAKFDYGTAIGEAMAPIDMIKKTAPYKAISDISMAEGASNLMGSKIIMDIAEKLKYGKELEMLRDKMRKQVISSR